MAQIIIFLILIIVHFKNKNVLDVSLKQFCFELLIIHRVIILKNGDLVSCAYNICN